MISEPLIDLPPTSFVDVVLADLPATKQAPAEPEGEGGHVLRTSEIEDAHKGAKILADLQPVTIDAGLALRRMIRTLAPYVEDLAEERQKIADRYAEKKDGETVETAQGTAIDPHRIRPWRLEWEAFQRKRHRVHGLVPIKLSMLVSAKERADTDKPAKIHAGALALLGVLLDEE